MQGSREERKDRGREGKGKKGRAGEGKGKAGGVQAALSVDRVLECMHAQFCFGLSKQPLV